MGDVITWVNGEVDKDVVYEFERGGVDRTEKSRDGCDGDENRTEGEFKCANDGEGGVG